MKINKEILEDIETTLEKLLKNHQMLENIEDQGDLQLEAYALKTLQESLQAHLSFLEEVTDLKRRIIHYKKNSPIRKNIVEKYRVYHKKTATVPRARLKRLKNSKDNRSAL